MLQGKKQCKAPPAVPPPPQPQASISYLLRVFWWLPIGIHTKSEFPKVAFHTLHGPGPCPSSSYSLPCWCSACETLLWSKTHSSPYSDSLFLSLLRFYFEILYSVMSSCPPTQSKMLPPLFHLACLGVKHDTDHMVLIWCLYFTRLRGPLSFLLLPSLSSTLPASFINICWLNERKSSIVQPCTLNLYSLKYVLQCLTALKWMPQGYVDLGDVDRERRPLWVAM